MAKIYLLYGEAELLIRERLAQLKTDLGGEALNIEQLDTPKPTLEELTTALQSSSLFGGDKLVLIKNADLSLKDWEALFPVMGQIAEATTLVIVAADIDRRSKVFRWFQDKAEVCEFKAFSDWDQAAVVAWITKRAQSNGKKIVPAAAERLQEICGNDLLKLQSEIEKMITYAGEKETIDLATVETLASPGQINVFALADAVANRDLKSALIACRRLVRDKVELVPLLASLASRFRLMLLAKGVSDPYQLAQTLKASPFYVKKCFQEAKRFSVNELQRALELLLDADLKLKSGTPPAPTVEVLLAELCLPGKSEIVVPLYG